MDKQELKNLFRKNNSWRYPLIEEHFNGYFWGYWAFQNAYGGLRNEKQVKLKKYEREVLDELKERAFLGRRSNLMALGKPIQFKEGVNRDSFILELMQIKKEYLDVSIGDFLVAVSIMFDVNMTPRSLRDKIEWYNKNNPNL